MIHNAFIIFLAYKIFTCLGEWTGAFSLKSPVVDEVRMLPGHWLGSVPLVSIIALVPLIE